MRMRVIKRRKQILPLAGHLDTSMIYAIVATKEKYLKRRHAWRVWQTLSDFGCKVYLVAPDVTSVRGLKVYPDLLALQGKVQVVVPCLHEKYLENLAEEAAFAGAHTVWFQEKNWSEELQKQCEEYGLQTVRGCVLKHKVFGKPLAFLHPCYWHGLGENKVAKF